MWDLTILIHQRIILDQVCLAEQPLAEFLILFCKQFGLFAGHQRNMSDCDMDATFYWIGMAAIATVAVLLPTILGITALFTK